MEPKNESKLLAEEPPIYGSIQAPIQTSGEIENQSYVVYPGRFCVLTVFALLSVVQSLAWVTFGTIPDESFQEFGLNDDDVTLLAGTWIFLVAHRQSILHVFGSLQAAPPLIDCRAS